MSLIKDTLISIEYRIKTIEQQINSKVFLFIIIINFIRCKDKNVCH